MQLKDKGYAFQLQVVRISIFGKPWARIPSSLNQPTKKQTKFKTGFSQATLRWPTRANENNQPKSIYQN